MSYSFEYIDIILLAMIAGFIFLRLRGILGKKTGFEDDINTNPHEYALHENFPNPFNPETQIRFSIGGEESVKLIIYDMMGRKVATLLSGQVDAGYHFIQWDGTNSIGSSVAAGVYIYTIQTGKHRDVNKMIYLK